MNDNFIISCEHGGNKIPDFAKHEIFIPEKILNSHKAYDKGACSIAIKLGELLGKKPIINTYSRLVIDFNRSLHHKNIFSKYSKNIKSEIRDQLVKEYSNYRQVLEKKIKVETIHLSVHSFTPIMNGIKRNCDFAVLYDPINVKERQIAIQIKRELTKVGIRCRLNYPYQGKADGLTTFFRKKIGKGYYGLELEFNQSIVTNWDKVLRILTVVERNVQKSL